MAEFYAHERVAKRAAELIESTAAERPAAFLTGAEGPDPMFFHGFWRCKARGFSFRKLGLHLHAVRCPEFLWELVAGAETSVQKAYTLGFLRTMRWIRFCILIFMTNAARGRISATRAATACWNRRSMRRCT